MNVNIPDNITMSQAHELLEANFPHSSVRITMELWTYRRPDGSSQTNLEFTAFNGMRTVHAHDLPTVMRLSFTEVKSHRELMAEADRIAAETNMDIAAKYLNPARP